MTWHLTSDLDEFERAAGEFLRADPVRNTVLLTVMASLRASGAGAYSDVPPYFGWYTDSQTRAAFLRTPPMPAIVTDAPADAMESLVGVLDEVPGLNGPAETVAAFAQAWHAATGRQPTVAAARRLYRLTELAPPQPMPPGDARPVGDTDRDLLAEWFTAFAGDVGEAMPDAARAVDRRLKNGELLLWEADGVPVSLAGNTTPVAGVARVAPVYTPATLRGKGYAGAVTAAVSRRALDAGYEVILFTNLANPTSNALYQRLGYRGIGDWSLIELG
ncbi:GNAT family N-acetyltransferase [Catenulispora sp. NL8]|uniref:GNAT family N-acetyltransferase n=1 Tax=Catenulispora pinistramenti TaxID=2705254 RepID=A0ABS5L5E5_9ACTN|nr:GNAT family N-acetyltransferase [Catenulispora pinistramenti]MBS2553563.1 GNAT family N-acetyltransferase [Catenulispora pinistramenti]